jgi:hypothetical protein
VVTGVTTLSVFDKETILKTLSTVDRFDNTASPFIALGLNDAKIYRSSSFGFIANKNMIIDKDSVFVSLDHLHNCLKAMPEERVELSLCPNGVLLVKSTGTPFESDLRVHTIPQADIAKTGMKRHELGKFTGILKPEVFKGLNVKPFPIVGQPLLQAGKLLLSTPHGIIMWQGPDALKGIKINPRDSFLRFISNPIEEIYLTETNYWGATNGPLVVFLSSHGLSPNLHQVYNVPGTKITEFPAQRLVSVLGAAAGLCDTSKKVEIHPDKGVVTRNNLGNLQEFRVGPQKGWDAFSIMGQTAKLAYDIFSQTNEETIVLSKVEQSFPTMRLTRGCWEFNFKVF